MMVGARVFNFVVPGKPVPKGRPRVLRNGITFTPKKTKDYEEYVRIIALGVKNRAGVSASACDFRLRVNFYGAHPRSDWDNLGKAISDALNGVFWKDDCQVVEAIIKKIKSNIERAEVSVEILTNV